MLDGACIPVKLKVALLSSLVARGLLNGSILGSGSSAPALCRPVKIRMVGGLLGASSSLGLFVPPV